jgi:3-hydroxy-9,10-secoandrosta-1,3,5(10)-triene-9,17-dione monooxygenase reductase component
MRTAHDHPVSADDYREALSRFAAGVVVVTGMGTEGPAGLTIQSFTALSLTPPLILLAIDRRSVSWPAIAASKRFAVNVMASEQQATALGFARSGGPKFDRVRWSAGEHTGAPLLAGSHAWLECETWQVYDGGDHEIVTATVLAVHTNREPGLHPLVFYRSKFEQLDRGRWPNHPDHLTDGDSNQ